MIRQIVRGIFVVLECIFWLAVYICIAICLAPIIILFTPYHIFLALYTWSKYKELTLLQALKYETADYDGLGELTGVCLWYKPFFDITKTELLEIKEIVSKG